jgi:hypothetical protein
MWKAHGRHKPGVMNKTEAAYQLELEAGRQVGEILWYTFEAITLKLADDCRYTPDFIVMKKDLSLECHEVKGFWQDDARVKIKVAAAKFPFRFIAVTKIAAKNGGGWNVEEF